MTENNIQGKFSFEAICFSTNNVNFTSISIMKQYFMSTICSDIRYISNHNVTFKHNLIVGNNNIECQNSYIEITPTVKNCKINKESDCFIIFYDLEYNDSLTEFFKIIKMISNLGFTDKKLYIIGIYTNENNKKDDDIFENEISKCLEQYLITDPDFSQVNIEESEDFAKKIDKITIECLQNKQLLKCDKDAKNDKSISNCLIN